MPSNRWLRNKYIIVHIVTMQMKRVWDMSLLTLEYMEPIVDTSFRHLIIILNLHAVSATMWCLFWIKKDVRRFHNHWRYVKFMAMWPIEFLSHDAMQGICLLFRWSVCCNLLLYQTLPTPHSACLAAGRAKPSSAWERSAGYNWAKSPGRDDSSWNGEWRHERASCQVHQGSHRWLSDGTAGWNQFGSV